MHGRDVSRPPSITAFSEREAETLRLHPGTTKNDEGRLVYLSPEHKVLLTAQVERVRAWMQRVPVGHRGRRRHDFRKAWASACRKAGVAGMLRH